MATKTNALPPQAPPLEPTPVSSLPGGHQRWSPDGHTGRSPWVNPSSPGRPRVAGDSRHADVWPWGRANGALATDTLALKASCEPGSEAGRGEVTLGSWGGGGPACKIPGEALHTPRVCAFPQLPRTSHLTCRWTREPGLPAWSYPSMPGPDPFGPSVWPRSGPWGGGAQLSAGGLAQPPFLGTCPFPSTPHTSLTPSLYPAEGSQDTPGSSLSPPHTPG